MGIPLALAFAAGLLAAFNPCGFALLPAYLAYFVGVSGGPPEGLRCSPLRAVGRAVVVSAVLTVGFAMVFGAVGFVVTIASLQVSRYSPWLSVAIGIALAALGVAMVAGFEPKLSLPRLNKGGRADNGLAGVFLFGVSYATVSLSCTLPPFLAAVATTVQETSLAGAMATFVLYAAGMGTVLAVLTVAVALAQRRAVAAMRRMLRHVTRVSGALLILAGGYVAWYGTYEILVNAGRYAPAGPVKLVTDLSGRVTLLVGEIGPTRIGVAAAGILVATLAAATLATNRSRPAPDQPCGLQTKDPVPAARPNSGASPVGNVDPNDIPDRPVRPRRAAPRPHA